MHTLQSVLDSESCATGLPPETVSVLVGKVDELKILGYTGGEASSKFGDYLGFLGLPDDAHMGEFFARRWSDHCVVTPVPPKLRHYVANDTPIFTVSRIEPQYQVRPFYKQGLEKVEPGSYGPPTARGPVRTAPPLRERFSNFIILANFPPVFYMEADNARISTILSDGLPKSDRHHPYKFYSTIDDARDSLFRDLATHGRQRSATVMLPSNFTLLEIRSAGLALDNDVFYTRTLSGHKQGSRAYGYYYTGGIDKQFLAVCVANI